jgi:hypothetical protein
MTSGFHALHKADMTVAGTFGLTTATIIPAPSGVLFHRVPR